MSPTRILVSCFAFALVSACGSPPQKVEPIRQASVPRPQRPGLAAISPADYVTNASAIDLYVIKASELALQRSATVKVREVASRLIAAHNGSSAQLSLGGRRLNLLPSAELKPRHRELLEQLYSSPSFDADYTRQMRAVHEEAALLHSSYAASGTSPTLIPIAKALAPVMEQQSRLISYL